MNKVKIVPNSKELVDFANAYNVKSIDLLKTYNNVDMKFTSFRKKKRLKGQKLELLEEIIQNEVIPKDFGRVAAGTAK